jgi:hypothetical protein
MVKVMVELPAREMLILGNTTVILASHMIKAVLLSGAVERMTMGWSLEIRKKRWPHK